MKKINVQNKQEGFPERKTSNKFFKRTKSLGLNVLKTIILGLIFKGMFWASKFLAVITIGNFIIFGITVIAKKMPVNINPFNQTINLIFNTVKLWFFQLPIVSYIYGLVFNTDMPLSKLKHAYEELFNAPTISIYDTILFSLPLLLFSPSAWVISEFGDLFLMNKKMAKKYIVFWLLIVFLFLLRFPLM
jgi:hypothetical protein